MLTKEDLYKAMMLMAFFKVFDVKSLYILKHLKEKGMFDFDGGEKEYESLVNAFKEMVAESMTTLEDKFNEAD